MLKEVVSLTDGMWVCDPHKITSARLMSAVLADRAGPDEISQILAAAKLDDGPWNYVRQEGGELKGRTLAHALADFSVIGTEYFLNQFLELDGQMLFWLPDFSEYSVCVFRPELYADLRGTLDTFRGKLDEWIEGDIWTKGERQFIVDGNAKYTVLPVV
jgi:hypothetical protein